MSGAGQPIDQFFNEQALEAQANRVRAILVSVAEEMKVVQSTANSLKGATNQGDIAAGADKLNAALNNLTTTNEKYKKSQQDLATIQAELLKLQNQSTEATGRQSTKMEGLTQNGKLLATALQNVKQQLQEGIAAGKLSEAQQAKLGEQVSVLNTLVNQQAKGFSSLTMELRAGERALQTMREAGLQADPAFKKLQLTVAESRREFNNFAKEQRILSAEAPAIQALTMTARGLGGAYAAGAGAAALFGDEHGKIEKELRSLVGIMTLLQGITELNAVWQQKNAIATAISVLWNKALTAVYGEEAIAAATATEATGALYVVMSAGLAIGIGAVVAALYYGIKSLNEWINTEEAAIEKTNKLNEASKGMSDARKEEAAILKEISDRGRERLANELADAEKSGASFAKIMALKVKLNEFDKKAADSAVTRLGVNEKTLKQQETAYYSAASAVRYYQHLLYDDAGQKKPEFKDDDETKLEQAKKRLEATKAIYELSNGAFKDSEKAKQEGEQLTLEKSKYNTEQRLKLVHEEALLEADLVTTKNNVILSSDESTLAQRIAAMKSNAEQQKKIILANRDLILNTPGVSTTDARLAREKAAEESSKIEIESAANITKIKTDAARKDLAVYTELQKNNYSIKKDIDNAIIEDENKKLSERASAIADEMRADEEIAKLDYNQKIQQAGLTANELAAIEQEYQNKLADIAIKGLAKIEKITEAANKKATAEKIKKLDRELKIEQGAEKAITEIVDGGFQNQINHIQDLINANTKAKDQEIKNINDSTLSAQDKANAIIIATATAAAKEDELNAKKRDEQMKQAKFDKEMAIFQIAINTAVAITKFLWDPGGIPGAALAIEAGILGAIELAAAIAKPLPHFVKGGIHAGGALIWGEEGQELAIEPGGKSYLTPGTASVGFAPAGTKIIPADQLNNMWQGLSLKSMTGREVVSDNGTATAIQQMGSGIIRQLKKRPPIVTNTTVNMDRVKWVSTNVKN